jgi:hypothetical protein
VPVAGDELPCPNSGTRAANDYTGVLQGSPPIPLRWQLALLALLAVLAYFPARGIPLIADDYPNISQALTYGSPAGIGSMLHDAQFRLRSTTYWVMYALWHVARTDPAPWHGASVLIHIFNTWMVLAIALAWPRLRPAAFWAAAFFAVHEGHQEAVMWFSAVSELLMFFFGAAALWCRLRGRDVAGLALFALALLSKESAIVFLPLFALGIERQQWKRALPRLAPYAVLTALALLSIAESRANSFRFSDGSFSLHAPFWITWPRSYARLLWVWGWAAAAAIAIFGDRRVKRSAGLALAWMGIALVPYIFLTYSTAIPSRQTYLASAGLAFLVGLALAECARRGRPLAAATLLALMIVHNTAYLWTKKRAQFVERAAPTNELIALARSTPGAIWVQCFPLPRIVAEEAVRLAAGRAPTELVWNAADAGARAAVPFCYADRKALISTMLRVPMPSGSSYRSTTRMRKRRLPASPAASAISASASGPLYSSTRPRPRKAAANSPTARVSGATARAVTTAALWDVSQSSARSARTSTLPSPKSVTADSINRAFF